MHNRLFALLILSLLPLTGAAAELVNISHAWARATAPGQEVGAAYMNLKSPVDATLTAVSSAAADSIEIHQMSMNKGVMEMRMMESLPLPAGKMVKLEPGGFHLMLFDLKKPLKAGEELMVTLSIKDKAGKVRTQKVRLPIRKSDD
jgi:hypothetical protein